MNVVLAHVDDTCAYIGSYIVKLRYNERLLSTGYYTVRVLHLIIAALRNRSHPTNRTTNINLAALETRGIKSKHVPCSLHVLFPTLFPSHRREHPAELISLVDAKVVLWCEKDLCAGRARGSAKNKPIKHMPFLPALRDQGIILTEDLA